MARLMRDPVAWGEAYLKDRDGSQRRYWQHQIEDLRCPQKNVAHMDGRDVGKTVALVTHLLHYAFITRGGAALVAAPHDGQINTITREVELQLDSVPALRDSIAKNHQGRPKLYRKPYFQIEFANGTELFFRPAGVAGDAFRSLHVDRLYVDEASYLTEAAWRALRMCLKTGGEFRVYATPNGIRDTTYYRLTKSKRWKLFHWPSWLNPTWDEERERELVEFYGGKNTPGWQQEVAGEHGMPAFSAFNLAQFTRCLVDIPEYQCIRLSGDVFTDCEDEKEVRERVETVLNLAPWEGTYWLGGDLGYTSDPTEFVLFEDDGELIRMVLRIHAEHVAYPVISEIIASIDSALRPAGIGVDNGGNGVSVVQELTSLDKYREHDFSERLHGFDFGGTTVIDYDGDKPLKKRTKEYMTALINGAINRRRVDFPDSDNEIEDQFASHRYMRGERHIIYSKGNDHVVDAVRCAFLAREMKRLRGLQPMVEENALVMPVVTEPVFW